jgi:hypothetical protein
MITTVEEMQKMISKKKEEERELMVQIESVVALAHFIYAFSSLPIHRLYSIEIHAICLARSQTNIRTAANNVISSSKTVLLAPTYRLFKKEITINSVFYQKDQIQRKRNVCVCDLSFLRVNGEIRGNEKEIIGLKCF